MQFLKNKNFYFLLSFIEGASVMAAELLGAKMLAPYFGSSLYVWSAVLAITLGGLAVGYFFGGVLSYKNKNPLTLFYVLLLAAVFTVFMPYTSKLVLWAVGMHSLIPAVIVSSFCILFPPVFMMGMVSPLIIRTITTDVDEAGRIAGAIYAVSTLGGIIATFAFGFYVIPTFGLTYPSIFTGIVLGLIPFLILLMQKQIAKSIGFFLFCSWAFSAASFKFSNNIKVVYNSEGLLGQIMVLDYPHYNKQSVANGYSRWLFVNRISQSYYDSLADESIKQEKYFTYVYHIADYIDSLPPNSKILMLGIGGGSIARCLSEKGYSVDVCELDERMAYVARKYFYLDDNINIALDDARHYIKTCTKKYDVIIFDTFKGEEEPSHVFTTESLEETKKILLPDGLIILNTKGYIDGSIGKSRRSIYKTFLENKFNVEVLSTNPNPDNSNLLFFASMGKIRSNPGYIAKNKIDVNDAVVLQDEFPILDILNAESARRWRVTAITGFYSNPSHHLLPVFH